MLKRPRNQASGFTLIEILIAIAIIGMMIATVIPYMQQMRTGYERKQFIARINSLSQVAWQQAVITGSVHRIMFNMKERIAFVERDVTKSVLTKKLDFEPIKVGEGSSMSWPRSIEIKQFIVGGYDEMRRFAGKRTETVWFYIIPDGMTQAVTINGVDRSELIEGRPKQFGLVMNPFFGQFKVYDAFQK